MDYAVVQAGGRQYRISEGQTLRVDKLAQEPGDMVELDQVLLLSRKGQVTLGNPFVEGVTVKALVEDHGQGEKVTVFKFKSKVRYRRKKGHRQPYTQLKVKMIGPTEGEKKTQRKARKSKKETKEG